ncbi:MAG TPA: tetratricopeptide repeat protein [Mucilaginibacter sp.]|jgi:tetratricopeptide (TPR) repeat protein|nr:tetratricopeptide repeat protein [Mucilaginibacter sp.]
MRYFYCLLLSIALFQQSAVFAQSTPDASSLIKEAVQLNKDGKYAEAAGKYTDALKLDSNNIYANYGIAFSLLNCGKGDDGIPYLEKVVKSNSSITAWAYDLLGSIYDKDRNSAKAIEAFNEGIKADPKYQRLYYNLGLVYFRDKNYGEAEKCAVQSIKLDPKHANSQRMYALVCFHQNKRANALLGLCSFILLEPNTARSTEAYGNIQHIIQGGTLKADPGAPPLMVDANTAALNQAITKAVAETGKKKYTSAGDLLTAQLTAIFTAIGPLADTQNGDDFFKTYYADYFYKLGQTGNMAAFARMIDEADPENAKWITEHPQYMNDLYLWIKSADRSF